MSRIGRKPINIPSGVKIDITNGMIKVSGPKGTLSREIVPEVAIEKTDSNLVVQRKEETKRGRQMHGMMRAIIDNMIVGVSAGYEKNLEVIGVGYRVEQVGAGILLALGYSHQIYFHPPEGIKLETDTPKRKINAAGLPNQLLTGTIKITGIDKKLVGQVAQKIRSFREPDPYKSKGIRYSDERIKLKAGKTAVK